MPELVPNWFPMAPADSPWPGRRPKRRSPRTEQELYPRAGSWLDLMPEQAGRSTRFVFACLEYGVLEAWQDSEGVIRLYLPEACGGHLIVGGPGDIIAPTDRTCSDPTHGDLDDLVPERAQHGSRPCSESAAPASGPGFNWVVHRHDLAAPGMNAKFSQANTGFRSKTPFSHPPIQP